MSLLLLAAALLAAGPSTPPAPVQVEIFEDLPAGSEIHPGNAQPTTRYAEPAFGFVRIPTRYSNNALPLDRSVPFLLRATVDRGFAPGEYQFRLRARGAAWFLIDGKVLLTTKPQTPNTAGDEPVPPPVARDNSPLRPLSHPHQEQIATVPQDGQPHRFTLVAVIGGKGLAVSPGELSVSVGTAGAIPRLLGPDTAPALTDEGWKAFAAAAETRHRAADVERRRAASVEVAAAWNERHRKVRNWVESQAAPVYDDIDRFISARLEAAKATPTALTSDLEFLRRLSLDASGVIPTAEQVRAFLAGPPGVRRRQAIDRVLADPGWADHWVSYWQDVLAENPGILKPDLNNTGPFRWWLHQSFTDNIPFDRLVTELIEMEGSSFQGGPAGFARATLNDAPMAAKADIVAQAFLGQRLACARCHDAPFHPFRQKDLFGLSAMLAGQPVKLPKTSTVPVREGARKPLVEVTLKPGDVIEPQWPFEKLLHADLPDLAEMAPPSHTSVPARHQLATLVVSPQNSRFAEVIVNRVWKRYLGAGLVEPADDWSNAKASHPELLSYLSREFLRSGYDLKSLARLIFSSDAYQRRPVAFPSGDPGPDKRLFAGPVRRQMSAEQLVDSLHRSVGKTLDSEELNLNPAGDRAPREFLNMGKPRRAWEMTALSNERDRPALALPIAQSAVDVLTTYGWRQSRQNPVTARDDAPSPMQTLILANGIMGTRLVRLSDEGAFTELSLQDRPLPSLVEEMFLRVFSRPPSAAESRTFQEYLQTSFADRRVPHAQIRKSASKTDSRVSWSNHLSAEATVIRMEEERRLRLGEEPTERLTAQFRERLEDSLWALVNAPEFVLIP